MWRSGFRFVLPILCGLCGQIFLIIGEKNGMSKLKNKDIPIIRNLLLSGFLQKNIALIFNISGPIISEISSGKIWSKV